MEHTFLYEVHELCADTLKGWDVTDYYALPFDAQVSWLAFHRLRKKERSEMMHDLSQSRLFQVVAQALAFFGIK